MLLNIDGNVVAVVGAGHKEGIQKNMENPQDIPTLYQLLEIKKAKITLN
jgi:pheromone shutdown protein TraB